MFVHTPRQISEVFEMNTLEFDKDEYDYNVAKTLIGTRLDRPFGKALPLETPWDLTFNVRSVEGNCHLLEGMAQINADQIGDQIISNSNLGTEEVFAYNTEVHSHKIFDANTDEYWNKIIVYLTNLEIPSNDQDEIKCINNRAKAFFILDGILWCRNGTKPPLQVVLDPERRIRLMKQAHDESGHRGKDPTFRKLNDAFWWPNQYNSVQEYCKTCHKCQMCLPYRNKVPIEPTYIRTILCEFGADTVVGSRFQLNPQLLPNRVICIYIV